MSNRIETPGAWAGVPLHVRSRTLGQEVVLLDLHREKYFGLDGVGARVWALLGKGLSRALILDQLHQEFDADIELLSSDVDALVSHLEQCGLIEIKDQAKADS